MTTKKIVGIRIDGELKQWRRNGQGFVRGFLEGEEEEVSIKLKYPLVHYPEGKDNSEYYLARTYYGNYYYYLALEEERT